ncbi:TonB-dependent receptor [Collimonas pratensis]|uniref:TonB dependent receptor family protein n=1 Tax=Collimonas pratensis TaxID=279113 RepID=A0A127Q8R7_9BURK|nr:TonB-dependent receptor [Collimonas pratensis]AMP06470.1 tonB dependent receptor family protein [Collimonas pratensis]
MTKKRYSGNLTCALTMAAASSAFWVAGAAAQQLTDGSADMADAAAAKKSARSSEQIASVLVTAQKRKEDASKVPLSISVISGEDLQASHINDFSDLTRAVPNVSFSGASGSGAGLSNIEIRGISSAAGSATVGVYLDDVSMTTRNLYSLGSSEPKFFDIDRIEVLRGPQGTLYGASSMGGTIKFISNQPNLKEREASVYSEVSGTAGGGTNYTVNGVVNQPLIPGELALRIGVQTGHQSGYIDQVSPTTGSVIASGINAQDSSVVKLAMKWAPTPQLSITPSVFYQEVNSKDIDASYLDLPKNQTGKLVREPGNDRLLVPSLTINYDLGKADLVSVSSFYQRTFNRTQDGTTVNNLGSAVPDTPPGLAAAIGALPSAVYLQNQVRQFSQELRVASKPYDQKVSPFTWLGGVYYANLHTNVTDNEPIFGLNATYAAFGANPADPGQLGIAFPNDNSYFSERHYHTEQEALFGELSYYFAPSLHATVGMRYLKATDSLSRNGDDYWNGGPTSSSVSTKSSAFTPKFSLSWEIDPNNTVYTSATEGFRLGGNDRPIPASLCAADFANLGITEAPTSFKSDKLWSYELGNKSRLLGNRLQVNAALFYIKWNGLQQDVTLPGCGFDYETNVGNASSYGAEFEIKAKPTSNIVLGLSGGYTNATLSSDVPSLHAHAGDPIQGVPKYNATLTGQYNFNLPGDYYGFARAAAHWTGSSHGTLVATDPDYQRPAYSTFDASIGATFDRWELTLFVKNAFNNDKVIQRPNVQSVSEGYRLDPRTIGISLAGKI